MGALRGSNRSENTLIIARAANDTEFEKAAQWAVMHLRTRGPLQRLRPRRLGELYQGSPLEPLPLNKELIWAREIVLQNRDVIRGILLLKFRIEGALLANDYPLTIQLLDELEATQGYSLFSVSTRLAVLQIDEGLEAQKEFLRSIRSQTVGGNLPFFGYWWSVRCEDSSSWQNFERDFKARLKRWSIDEAFRAHIAFEVLKQSPREGEEASLICGSYRASAFDIYEVLIALAETCLIERREAFEELVPLLRSFDETFDDPRLTKILFLAGQSANLDQLSQPVFEWRDALVVDEPTLPAELPMSLEEVRAAALMGHTADEASPLAKRIGKALGSRLRPEETSKGQAALRKLGAMFDHLSSGRWLTAYASDPHLLENQSSAASSLRRFINSSSLEPEVKRYLDQDKQQLLTRSLQAPSTTPYLAWLDKLATHQMGSGSGTLSRIAELELDILSAVANERLDDLLHKASEFETVVGDHSHLSLNARLKGELGLNGIQAAASFAVDRLLKNKDLAAWLPISAIAKQIIDEGVDAGSIDIPILLHFAAQEQSDPFASERTYAVEDYLAARGALRPTDLTSRIDRSEATDKELFFFRECCAASSLRISTLFQNETELEEERIALCQWLIAEKDDETEALEEEGRELVRGRLVRQGLKELEGSKLSIDSAGLRQWADRTLREDYNRYIDLLESGLVEIDEDFKKSVFDALGSERAGQPNFEIPKNEGAELLGSIVTRAVREFALHSEHGLDAYLSLRIRHGTISGHLRGPIEELKIITRRRSDGSYLPNEHWIERLGGALPQEAIQVIDDWLTSLSRQYDELIFKLTNELIQVRTADKPQGLIPVEVSNGLLALVLAETNETVTFENFMVRCEDIFWVIVSSGSGFVGRAIEDAAGEIQSMFDGVEERLRDVGDESCAPLRDALVRGKGTALSQLEKIGEWLQPPTTQGAIALDIDALVNVSLSVIQGFNKTFQPTINLKIESNKHLDGAVRWFSDVFFILFENVIKYSGNAIDPEIDIRIVGEAEHLSFRVANTVANMTADQVERIEEAREKIRNGSFRTAVRSEGGTGLPKLAKVIGVGKGGELDFDYDEETSVFAVQFKVATLEIAGGEGDG